MIGETELFGGSKVYSYVRNFGDRDYIGAYIIMYSIFRNRKAGFVVFGFMLNRIILPRRLRIGHLKWRRRIIKFLRRSAVSIVILKNNAVLKF